VLLNVLTALLFLLVLTPFAIVSMRTGIVRAMRMSVRLVATSLPTALVLVLATSVLSSLAFKFAPMGRVGALLAQSGDAMVVERQLQSLAGLPLDALAAGVLGVILAWYVAAMMLWCSDVHRAGVPEPPENPALC
jgi:hypothetical protein